MTQLRSYGRPALVILGGLLLGWLVLAVTIDRVFARTAPALALSWNPGSADANARLADAMFQEDAAPTAAKAAPALPSYAERSLWRQPVNPVAARLLAVTAAAVGQQARTVRLLAYAEAMSRRDLPTQLMLIEIQVSLGDVVGALLHYDRAMRTSEKSWPTLFPVLARAADEPGIGSSLISFLKRRPPWARPFLETFVAQSRSPTMLYAIARNLRLDAAPSPDFAMLQAIEKRLVDLRAYRPAAALYERAHGVQPGTGLLLHNGGFEQPGGWDPFDWNLADDPELSADREPSPAEGRGTALFLSASNGRGGEVAGQMAILPPGHYRISARVGSVGGDKLAYPQLIVRCATDGRELLHQAFPGAPDRGVLWALDLTVPADCPAERVMLEARSPLEAQEAVPWIDDLAIHSQGQH